MGNTTQIEWTATYHPDGTVTPGSTWNPWHGCTKVSPGCAHCYMYRDKARYGQDATQVVRSKTAFEAPLKWAEGRRIFTCSWSDWNHPTADPWRPAAWDIIRRTPQHTYLILTKRPERFPVTLPPDWGQGWPHVWIGASFENQHWFDVRAPLLYAVPAVVRFGSFEPLLGPINTWDRLHQRCERCHGTGCGGVRTGKYPSTTVFPPGACDTPCPACQGTGLHLLLHWAIVGGESGPDARPMHPEWAELIRDSCQEVGAAYFFKQWGEWAPVPAERECWHDFLDLTGKIGQCYQRADGTWRQDPRGPSPAIIERVGKHRAGRLLDGREWNEMPEVLVHA